jgi:hypothetical protein
MLKKYKKWYYLLLITALIIPACKETISQREIQLSHDMSKNFNLDNRYNFSPDDLWLVYDTRTEEGGIGGCRTIEKINVETGESILLYQAQNATTYGPGVGAASYSHTENKVIFIHGLLNCSANRPYEQWRRTGVIIDEKDTDKPIFMDARDVTLPFTPGALRGGTHDHEWSADGQWIGFTYNDAIMKELEDRTRDRWNLRTIGVARSIHPVKVDRDSEGENNNGIWFSVIVVKVVPNPIPGSDEIDHAAGDCWVGDRGYLKPEGNWQRARAFLGTVRSLAGTPVKEVFVVDIPENINIPGNDGPLQGTETSFPMPPEGAIQRRLTYTAETEYPGCLGILHCSPDGRWIAYRAKDKAGINQVFFISPLGGEPIQVTHHHSDVQSDVHWHNSGKSIYYICDNHVTKCDLTKGPELGSFRHMTVRSQNPPSNLVLSHNGKILAFNRDIFNEKDNKISKQIFIVK